MGDGLYDEQATAEQLELIERFLVVFNKNELHLRRMIRSLLKPLSHGWLTFTAAKNLRGWIAAGINSAG